MIDAPGRDPMVRAVDDAPPRTSRSTRLALIAMNVLGGLCVLGSYAHGFITHPAQRTAIWGGVPESLRPVYTVAMLLATLGYFPLTYTLVLRPEGETLRVGEGFGGGLLLALYGLVLVPSALWLPLTYAMLESPSAWLWAAIRVDLLAVGFGALGLWWSVGALRPPPPRGLRIAARLGASCFVFQTAVLDALIWPAFFPFP